MIASGFFFYYLFFSRDTKKKKKKKKKKNSLSPSRRCSKLSRQIGFRPRILALIDAFYSSRNPLRVLTAILRKRLIKERSLSEPPRENALVSFSSSFVRERVAVIISPL